MGSLYNNTIMETLTIKNPGKETIYGIIGRMEVLLNFLGKHDKYQALIPFLKTYYLVTKTVAEKHATNKNYYKDFDQLQRLDIHFASLYFNAIKIFIKTGKAIKPWNTYFEYCKKNGNVILQILLGVNAHINGDLPVSLHVTRYNQRRDFAKINRILEETIPEVISFLVLERGEILTGIEAILSRRLIRKEFRKIIVKWRKNAWDRHEHLNGKFNEYKSFTSEATEQIGSSMIKIFDNFSIMRPSVSITNFNHLVSLLKV